MYRLYFSLLRYSSLLILFAVLTLGVKSNTIYLALREEFDSTNFYKLPSKIGIYLATLYLAETGLTSDEYASYLTMFYVVTNAVMFVAFTVLMVKLENHVADIYYQKKNSEVALFTLQ